MDYAGFWLRFVAYLIDTIILSIINMIIAFMFGYGLGGLFAPDLAETGGSTYLLYNAINIVIGVGYFVALESSVWQATLGKKWLGLIVVDEAGERISPLRAIGRYFAKILSALILMIGFIMAAFTQRKQGLHDMICKTLVLRGTPGSVSSQADVFS